MKHLLSLIFMPFSIILEMPEKFHNFSLTKASKLSYRIYSTFFLWLKSLLCEYTHLMIIFNPGLI